MHYEEAPKPEEIYNKRPDNIEGIAHFLFALLDDIDTLDDMAKDSDHAFRTHVRNIVDRRFEVATTDGYKVAWRLPGTESLKDSNAEEN